MTPLVLAALLAAALLGAAVCGPALLRWSAPALARVPRLAVTLLVSSAVMWTAAILALGPLAAWAVAGPHALPGVAGDMCQRCVAAANPFGSTGVDSAVPAAVLVLGPVTIGAALVAGVAVDVRRRLRETRLLADTVRAASSPVRVAGEDVLLIDDDAVRAFALPRRRGGIVVSRGTLLTLTPEQLRAVLAHERAHLDQRHHLVGLLLAAFTSRLRWIPLIDAIAAAVPHFFEIAADEAARRHSGTSALAAALLTVSGPGSSHLEDSARVSSAHESTAHPHAVLHMASGTRGGQPDRIGHLVGAHARHDLAGPLLTIGGYLLVLTTAAALVHGPYLTAMLAGCA